MKSLFKLVLVIFTLAASSFANASTSDELSTLLNSVHTMRADFVQTIYDNHGKKIQQSFGRMAVQRPGKFRWDVTKPIPELIIANETKLWIYDSDLEQVTIRKIQKAAGETPALLLSQVDVVLQKDYNVKELPKKDAGLRWFQLAPLSADNMFATIQMGFSDKQIHEMILQDHLGHQTRVQFQHIEENVNLSPSLFTFHAPSNVDVIDETKKK